MEIPKPELIHVQVAAPREISDGNAKRSLSLSLKNITSSSPSLVRNEVLESPFRRSVPDSGISELNVDIHNSTTLSEEEESSKKMNAISSVSPCMIRVTSEEDEAHSNESIKDHISGRFSELEIGQPSRIQWFQETFNVMGKRDIILLKDLKYACKEHKGFAENLFQLFDTDCSDSISMQELVGGLRRLTIRGNQQRSKSLKWFQKVLLQVSGEDEMLQLEDFKKALSTNGFVEHLYQLMDVEQSGQLTTTQVLEAFQNLTCMNRDAKWLEWFEQQFHLVAGGKHQINLSDFKKALNVKQSFFAERFFYLFDKDGSGFINSEELMDGLTLLTSGSKVDKLHFLFQVYDVDGNGFIDFEELRTVLRSCMDESNLHFTEQKLDELTRALFENTDMDNSGSITFEELQEELSNHPGVVENLTISAANWLKPPATQHLTEPPRTCHRCLPHWMSWHYLQNNLAWVSWITAFVLVNFFLFMEASIRHRHGGPQVAIARGCGQCLNFNPTFIVILMMRKGITWLRSTRLAFILPLDQHIDLHKICGWTIMLFSSVHTVAHLINFVVQSLKDNGLKYWQYLFSVHTGYGWVGGAAGLTGLSLLVVLLVMVVCSLPFVRDKGYFQVFYWTHNLFTLWFILLILHASHFWKWFLVPGILYIVERIWRSKWVKLARYGRTYIKEGQLLPSKVTHLVLTRPVNFSYQPGDYIFIQIPDIAKYEWHPFTISSAPEQQGFIWLHIRSVGTWTKELYEFFEKRNKLREHQVLQVQMPKEQQSSTMHELLKQAARDWESGSCDDIESLEDIHPMAVTETDRDRPDRTSLVTHGQDFSHMYAQPTIIRVQAGEEDDKGIEVYIDGPYGTPSTHIFQAEHAVLIGAGIGVTPFASILQSIMMKYRNSRQVCPRCNHDWTEDIPTSVMKLKKVDFFWTNRDQKSFEWFVSLLSQLEIEQSDQCGFEHFLEMHMYMTSALRKTDVKAIGLQMALDLIHKKDKRDLITGLKTRTQAGRPDWDKVFQKLEGDHQGKVTVFFCGPPAISKVLKRKCSQYGFEFRKETF